MVLLETSLAGRSLARERVDHMPNQMPQVPAGPLQREIIGAIVHALEAHNVVTTMTTEIILLFRLF